MDASLLHSMRESPRRYDSTWCYPWRQGLSEKERERGGREDSKNRVGFTRRIGHRTDLANLSYAAGDAH